MTKTKALINRQWTVAQHPTTDLRKEHFGYKETGVDEIANGQILLKTHYLNLAPVMRMYMMKDGGRGESTETSLSIGDVIHGRGVAEVLESRHPEYEAGDFIHGQVGWQTYKISNVTKQEKIVKMEQLDIPIHYGLSALGMTGYSAYCGFVSRGAPKVGDDVLVSGAAGGVGSMVVQIAKAKKCGRVIGIAGGSEKCNLVKSLGADDCIDYRNDDIAKRVKELLPDGIDIYFDNVGGSILETALDHLAYGAKVILCGSISEYTLAQPFGPTNYTRLRRHNADMKGFFVYNHQSEFAQARNEMGKWISEGKLKAIVDMKEGFEQMPDALIGLYTGKNKGKQMCRIYPGEDIKY